MAERYKVHNRRPPPNPKGRGKGTPNKITTILKEAAILATQQVGEPRYVFKRVKVPQVDRRTGQERMVMKIRQVLEDTAFDGVVGYFRWAAKQEPAAWLAFLSKIMPTQVKLEGIPSNSNIDNSTTLVNVDLSKLSVEQLAAMYRDFISNSPPPPPLTIEHQEQEPAHAE